MKPLLKWLWNVSKTLKNNIKPTCIVKTPKEVDILPLIPIFAGFGSLGILGVGAAGMVKAVNNVKCAKNQFEEAKKI